MLRYLPTNLARPEIVGELSISLNTVNTHIRKIYAKLGATDRTAAVQRGRELPRLQPAAPDGVLYRAIGVAIVAEWMMGRDPSAGTPATAAPEAATQPRHAALRRRAAATFRGARPMNCLPGSSSPIEHTTGE